MPTLQKVLVANRGEIAVRVVRAAADCGLRSVAVHATPDADALWVRMADEAWALDGATPADSYLDIDAILSVARRSGADCVHPGYGFLAENADFAHAVIGAGLTWIGPPPEAIEQLGDKVTARQVAASVGAPLVPGTADPVADAEEVLAFADAHGLPLAIKAAFGGGGRGLKVARTREEVRPMFESATREAVTAFGRGECFVERYLDRPRHVETQCLADRHGHVQVVSTRDCSLQRRHQKLLEEAPAPFLTEAQDRALRDSSRAILRAVGYVGAGTCEFLVGTDGTISFLEVNTRLQVEHPVTEEVTGVDLVAEMFRIAAGESIEEDDPSVRGHSLEFRVNAEDPGRGFLPAPGTLTTWRPPSGPGVRVDAGYVEGDTVPGVFDSLVAKIIVTGATREQALARARRALDETVVEGMPTVLPFARRVLDDPAFTGPDHLGIHTSWIGSPDCTIEVEPAAPASHAAEPDAPRVVAVAVNGRRVEVALPASLLAGGAASSASSAAASSSGTTRRQRRSARSEGGVATVADSHLTSPMQGTIVTVDVAEGDTVAAGERVLVLEAMKMEQPITAHRDGTVTALSATAGAGVGPGEVLCEIV